MSSCTNKRMHAEDFRSLLKSLKMLRVVHVELDSLSTISPCIGEKSLSWYFWKNSHLNSATQIYRALPSAEVLCQMYHLRGLSLQ
uniref:Uncharacterized protein n=1 Tax=Arundo donax TaxID=35708 RepID=A0A0A9HKP7_ARUDO